MVLALHDGRMVPTAPTREWPFSRHCLSKTWLRFFAGRDSCSHSWNAVVSEPADNQQIVEATRHWLEKLVIGLNLCPFAGLPWRQGRVRIKVSDATRPQELAEELADELMALRNSDPAECETTLLIHPQVLGDFLEYNDFLEIADRLLEDLSLDGTIQIASFHPDYQFADSQPDDPANYTNRSPYPMLHLLREASVEAAIASIPDPDAIFEHNIKTLRSLGVDGWKELLEEP